MVVNSQVFYKKNGEDIIVYDPSTWPPIVFPNGNAHNVITGSESIDYFIRERKIIKARYVITGQCNLRCYHCYASDHYDRNGVSTEDAMRIVDQIADAGAIFLQIDGGEVGLRNDLSEIINYATTRGLFIDFFTNGTLFDSNFFDKTNFKNIYAVMFSIHAATPELHNRLTGVDNSFEKAIENIIRMREKVRHTFIKMAITKSNLKQVSLVRNLSKMLKVGFVYSTELFPQDVSDIQDLDENDFYYLKEQLGNSFFVNSNRRRCIGGVNSCTIDCDGTLYPCRFIRVSFGNILQKSLVELWHSQLAIDTVDDYFIEPEQCVSCDSLTKFCFCCPALTANKKQSLKYFCDNAMKKRDCYDTGRN